MKKTPFVQGYDDTFKSYEKNKELPENPYKETDSEYPDYTRGMTYASQVLLNRVVDRVSNNDEIPDKIIKSMDGLKTSFGYFADMQDKFLNSFNKDMSESSEYKDQHMANVMFACENIQRLVNDEDIDFPYPNGHKALALIKGYKIVIEALENNELDDIDEIIDINNNFELTDPTDKFE